MYSASHRKIGPLTRLVGLIPLTNITIMSAPSLYIEFYQLSDAHKSG